MVRTRHYGGDSSAHDKTGPPDRGDYRRPLGAPPPESPGVKPRAGKGCAVLILLALSSVAGLAEAVRELARAA